MGIPDLWTQAIAPLAHELPSAVGLFYCPRCVISDSGEGYLLVASLPGISEGGLDLRVLGRTLVLGGQPAQRGGTAFYRAVELPSDSDTENLVATLAGGVLEVTIPRTTAEQIHGTRRKRP